MATNRASRRRGQMNATRRAAAAGARSGRSKGRRTRGLSLGPFLWLFGSAGVLGLLVYVVVQATSGTSAGEASWLRAELNDTPSLPGLYIKPEPGPNGKFEGAASGDDRQHVAVGTKIPLCSPEVVAADAALDVNADRKDVASCYTSNPPTSGPHSESPMAFKVLENPAPKENLLHNMEHGGVVVWYNTEDQDAIKQLSRVVKDARDRGKLVTMSKYPDMEPDTIALTAWTRLDKFPVSDLAKGRVRDFINAHSKRFNPEGF